MPTASPVSITSLSRLGNVVTVVTAAPHNLAANQGCSINGVTLDATFNGNVTITSVVNATTFTFAQTGANSSAGAGGTVTAARQVIILAAQPNGPNLTVPFLFWLTTAQGVSSPGATSQWSGASTQEVLALRAGTTVEQGGSMAYPATYTKAQIQTDLQIRYAAAQASLAQGVQPGQFYGGFYDGAGWSF